jgi:hypothetical protein
MHTVFRLQQRSMIPKELHEYYAAGGCEGDADTSSSNGEKR